MKNLDRYTVTSLWLADFLSDPVRRIILTISKCSHLNDADKLLGELCTVIQSETRHILHTNPVAMKKISEDARTFGFSESELSRRLKINAGEHTNRIAVCTWDYNVMVSLMLRGIDSGDIKLNPQLTGKVYDKARKAFRIIVDAIIKNGCYAVIDGKERRYRFFAASAGQMRKQRFILMRDDVYRRHNEALTLGLTEDKINAAGGILASKFLPYKALCMSCGMEAEWFDVDKMIVIPDREINLTAVVDTVTTSYDVIRGERNDIRNPINDGIGFYWLHDPNWKPVNIQVRYAYVKGLLTPLNWVSLYKLYGQEPIVTDLWGQKHHLIKEGIEVILTESQFKMAKLFSTLEEYRTVCKQYQRAFCILNQDGEATQPADLSYQMCQSLISSTDDELATLAQKSIHNMKNMLTPAGALNALGANKPEPFQNGFQKSLQLLPELLGDAYTQEELANQYDTKYRSANSGRLESNGRYHYIVPDPIALFEACFLGRKPVGVLKAGEVWVKHMPSGHKVDVLRSPHMHTTEHTIRTIAPYRTAMVFMDTDAVYINVHDLLPRQLMCDFDGDIALVVDDDNLVKTAEHCNADANTAVLYYEPQKAPKKPLNDDAIVEAIFNAADFNKIGIYSIYAVKLLASDHPDLTTLAKLAAAGNYAIDAVKTGAAIELPKGIEKSLRQLRKPHWWRYDHQSEEHPYTDSAYWDEELDAPGRGVIDRLGQIIRNAVPAKATLQVPADPALWPKMVIDPRRKTIVGVIDVFKDCARRNAAAWNELFAKRPDLHDDWIAAGAIAEQKIAAARQEIITAAQGDLMGAYDTITRGLFKYPNETSFKRFYWQVFGDVAAEAIKSNMEHVEEATA